MLKRLRDYVACIVDYCRRLARKLASRPVAFVSGAVSFTTEFPVGVSVDDEMLAATLKLYEMGCKHNIYYSGSEEDKNCYKKLKLEWFRNFLNPRLQSYKFETLSRLSVCSYVTTFGRNRCSHFPVLMGTPVLKGSRAQLQIETFGSSQSVQIRPTGVILKGLTTSLSIYLWILWIYVCI